LEDVKDKISEDNNVSKESVVAFDIKFLYELDGEVIELEPKDDTVQVTFNFKKNSELKEANKDDNQRLEVYHVDLEEDVVEKIDVVETTKNEVVVEADSFTIYAVVAATTTE
jgi:hypothetical protein